MSRDWTPRELHMADEYCFKETGEYMHDRKIVLVLNGKETDERMDCMKYPDLYEKFPNLSFLWGADYVKKYQTQNLAYVEEQLSLIVSGNITNDTDKTILRWYNGELDPHFYYREENDEILKEYILGLQ